MADLPNSTPPAWKELEPFRQTFFRHVFDEETVAALRKFGAFLFEGALEFATTAEVPEGSEISRDLRAVAADLRYLRGYLSHVVAASAEASTLAPEDAALAAQAGAWAVQVGATASEIESALVR